MHAVDLKLRRLQIRRRSAERRFFDELKESSTEMDDAFDVAVSERGRSSKQ
jgi:hypothetical protein